MSDDGRRESEQRGRAPGAAVPPAGERHATAPDPARLLSGSSAAEVLRRIEDGDPLGIEKRVEARLRERALLLSRERVTAAAMAQAAFAARFYRSWQPLDAWLRPRIEAAIASVIEQDREDERAARVAEGPPDESWAFVSQLCGIEPHLARRACLVFNELPRAARAAFFALAVDGKTLAQCAAEGATSVGLVEARVKRALHALADLQDPGGVDPPDEEDRDA